MDLTFFTFLNFTDFNFTNLHFSISALVSILCIFILTYQFILSVFQSCFCFKKLNNEAYLEKYFCYFSELKNTRRSWMMTSFYMYRRIYLACLLIFLRNQLIVQLILLNISNIFHVLFLIIVWPYKSVINNLFSIFNEIMILLTSLVMMTFFTTKISAFIQEILGWIAVCNITFVCMINCIYLLGLKLIQVIRLIAKLRHFWKINVKNFYTN